MHTRITLVVALALVALGASQTHQTAHHAVRVASAQADSTNTTEHRSGYIIASS